ncbi:hypothetical protein JW707_03200 [Candidatus Woesearchaeota archaeon]|nr:hypothetical protein [Candidatus Woesearchaeota archaeon]
MKLSDKVVEAIVSEVAGSDVLPLVRALKNKKNVSEFKLAEDIKQEINTTRNMLYRLHNSNLVTFIRKKDKKKGWYIYYWTFNPKMVKYLSSNLKEKKLEKVKERLKREKSGDFFTCESQCVRLDFEQSTEFQFKCPECGALLNQEDNKEKIKELEKEIKALEKEIKKNK